MSIIMVYWDWKPIQAYNQCKSILSKDNITHGGGANFNSRVAKCESVDSLTITGAQTLSCALGLQESMKGYA